MNTEDEARSLGWRPLDEWKGPPEKWRDADAFMEYGQRSAGFVRKALQADLEAQKAEFQSQIDGIKRAADSALDAVQKNAEAERNDLLAQLNEKKKAAIADNDLAALETVKEQIAEVKEAKPQGPDPVAMKAAEDFKAKHSFWQGKDWVVQNFADGAAGRLQSRNLSPPEFFTELDTQIREAFPEKFGKPKRRSAVEGDSPKGEDSGDGKSFADLPKAARDMYEAVLKPRNIKGLTPQNYADEYFKKDRANA